MLNRTLRVCVCACVVCGILLSYLRSHVRTEHTTRYCVVRRTDGKTTVGKIITFCDLCSVAFCFPFFLVFGKIFHPLPSTMVRCTHLCREQMTFMSPTTHHQHKHSVPVRCCLSRCAPTIVHGGTNHTPHHYQTATGCILSADKSTRRSISTSSSPACVLCALV